MKAVKVLATQINVWWRNIWLLSDGFSQIQLTNTGSTGALRVPSPKHGAHIQMRHLLALSGLYPLNSAISQISQFSTLDVSQWLRSKGQLW